MSDSKNARRQLIFGAIFLFVLLLASRLVSVFYSYVKTDILYSESLLPDVLYYARQVLSAAAFGAGIAASVFAVFRFGKEYGAAAFGIHSALLFADILAAYLIDVISRAVSEEWLSFAALVAVGEWLFLSALSLAAWGFACRSAKRKKGSDRVLLVGSLVHLGGWLLLEIFYLIEFLIDVDFLPYRTEIVVIVGQFLSHIVLNGGAVWIAALAFFALFSRLFDEKSE